MAEKLHCDICDTTVGVKPKHIFTQTLTDGRVIKVLVQIQGKRTINNGSNHYTPSGLVDLDVCERDARKLLHLTGMIAAQEDYGAKTKAPKGGTSPAEETPRDPGEEPPAAGPTPASAEPAA